MKIFFSTILSILLVFTDSLFAQRTVVSGNLENCNACKEIFIDDVWGETEVGYAPINMNGNFKITAHIEHETICSMHFNDENSTVIILSPGDSVYIKLDYNNLDSMEITGSEGTDYLKHINKNIAVFTEKENDARKAYETQLEIIRHEKKNYIRSFLQSDTTLASFILLNEFSPEKDFELFELLVDALKNKDHTNPLIDHLSSYYDELLQTRNLLNIGTLAPEIKLHTANGKPIELSDLKGKYVLIDFWASWCVPCRAANIRLAKIYENYKKYDFEIFGISLDRDFNEWKNAISVDRITWLQASDLSGFDSEVAQAYKVSSIPFTVLIDKEGKVICTDLRGEDLEDKLKEILIK